MDERRRRTTQVVLAIVLLLGGTWLLYAGAVYMAAWMAYETRILTPTTCGAAPCIVQWGLMPAPGIVTISYLVAIPAMLGIARWVHRGRPTDLRRAGSNILTGAMGWMTFLIAVGIVWPFLLHGSIVWSMFLVSILDVPPFVLAAGFGLLWDGRRQRDRNLPRANGA